MSKLLLGAVAGIGAIGGGAYYVSQVAVPDIDTPPYLAAASVGSVYATLSHAALPAELARLDSNTNPELAGLADVRIVTEPEQDRALRWTLVIDDTRYVTVSATLKAVGAKTAVDVSAAFPDSPFTQSGHLHPYDLKVIAAAFDLGFTDYIASIIEKRPPRSWTSIGRVLEAKLGFDPEQKRAMGERLQAALAVAQAPIMERAMARSGATSDEVSRAMSEAADAMESSGSDRDAHDRGRQYDPRDTMRSGVRPSTSAEPMVDVGNGR
jgi:hypothetical protein